MIPAQPRRHPDDGRAHGREQRSGGRQREAGRREPPLVPHGRSLASGDPWTKDYDAGMAPFMRPLREHVGNFFTNWSESDLPVARKVALTLRNRAISVVNKGCCGHHGEPGC